MRPVRTDVTRLVIVRSRNNFPSGFCSAQGADASLLVPLWIQYCHCGYRDERFGALSLLTLFCCLCYGETNKSSTLVRGRGFVAGITKL